MTRRFLAIGLAFLNYNLGSAVAMAQTVNFDTDAVGTLPTGWSAGVTGRGCATLDGRARRQRAIETKRTEAKRPM